MNDIKVMEWFCVGMLFLNISCGKLDLSSSKKTSGSKKQSKETQEITRSSKSEKTVVPNPSFNPVGKTEQEVIENWKQPISRMDLGDETYLTYRHGTVVLQGGIGTSFDSEMKANASTTSASSSSAAKESSTAAAKKTASAANSRGRSEADRELLDYIEKLEKDIESKTIRLKQLREIRANIGRQTFDGKVVIGGKYEIRDAHGGLDYSGKADYRDIDKEIFEAEKDLAILRGELNLKRSLVGK